jgi:hypothetical protein
LGGWGGHRQYDDRHHSDKDEGRTLCWPAV